MLGVRAVITNLLFRSGFILLCLAVQPVFATDIVLKETGSLVPVNFPSVYIDESSALTVTDVSTKSFLENPQRTTALGPVAGAVWLRFSVTNLSNAGNWLLEVDAAILHEVVLYRQSEGGTFEAQAVDVAHNFDSRPVKVNKVLLPMKLAVGKTSLFFLRVTSSNIVRVPLKIGLFQTFYETNHRRDFINGMLYGLMFTLMLYNLFVYLSLKDRTYLYYVGYIFFWALNTIFVNGYIIDFFPFIHSLNSANLYISLTAVFSILFTTSFLRTKKYVPVAYRLQWVMLILFILPLTIALSGYESTAYVWTQWSVYPFFIYWLWTGVAAYRRGLQPAIYFLWGYSVLSVSATIYNLKDNGFIPDNIFTDVVLQLGSAFEALILSFALANKLHYYKKNNEELQRDAFQQSERFAKTLLKAQEDERKRIASELHDSIGQRLILIKNKVLLLQTQENLMDNQFIQNLPLAVAETIQEVRAISYGLRPYQIDMLGLTQAIKSLVTETLSMGGIACHLEVDNIDGLIADEYQINVYRIIQECLNNMIKHSCATRCVISVKKRDGILISVEDNGVGLTPDNLKSPGLGLLGIRERTHLAGGVADIGNGRPQGTTINISIPLTNLEC